MLLKDIGTRLREARASMLCAYSAGFCILCAEQLEMNKACLESLIFFGSISDKYTRISELGAPDCNRHG